MSAKCSHILQSGKPCRNWAVGGSNPPLCNIHGGKGPPHPKAQICTHATHQGQPCRNWAVIGSHPPRCASHAGLNGAPTGQANGNWKHGFYEKGNTAESVDGMIEDLLRKQDRNAELLDRVMELSELMPFMTMHVSNAAKVMKMLLDQKALEGEDDDLLAKLGPALDLVKARIAAKEP